MEWTANPTTGQLEAIFQGKLASVSSSVQTNSNGTEFRVGLVILPNGKERSCRIYEKNYAYGMEIGKTYRGVVTQYADSNGEVQLDLRLSHLTNAQRATLADFDFEDEVIVETQIAEQALK